jgi:hypothetical protein
MGKLFGRYEGEGEITQNMKMLAEFEGRLVQDVSEEQPVVDLKAEEEPADSTPSKLGLWWLAFINLLKTVSSRVSEKLQI